MLGQRLLRLFGLGLGGQGDGYPPVIAVCHGTTLTHPSQAGGWTGAARRRRSCELIESQIQQYLRHDRVSRQRTRLAARPHVFRLASG
jgi:hypothetical protein